MPRAIEAEAKYAFCVNSDPGANLQMSFPRWGQRKNIGTCPRTPLACSCPRALLFPHLRNLIAKASELKRLLDKDPLPRADAPLARRSDTHHEATMAEEDTRA